MKIVEPIIGKKNWQNGWDVQPNVSEVERTPRLKQLLTRSSGVVSIRIRPGFLDARGKSGQIAEAIAQHQAALQVDGKITVTTAREYDKNFKVHRVVGSVTIPADTVVQVGMQQALLILDRAPFSYIFEEVDTGASAKTHAAAKSSGEALAMAAQAKAEAANEIARLQKLLDQEKRARLMAERQAAAKADTSAPAHISDPDEDAEDAEDVAADDVQAEAPPVVAEAIIKTEVPEPPAKSNSLPRPNSRGNR